jgi:hypothetical protein
MVTHSVSAGTGLVNTTRFSHGTLECHDLAASRRCYEGFLGWSVCAMGNQTCYRPAPVRWRRRRPRPRSPLPNDSS